MHSPMALSHGYQRVERVPRYLTQRRCTFGCTSQTLIISNLRKSIHLLKVCIYVNIWLRVHVIVYRSDEKHWEEGSNQGKLSIIRVLPRFCLATGLGLWCFRHSHYHHFIENTSPPRQHCCLLTLALSLPEC